MNEVVSEKKDVGTDVVEKVITVRSKWLDWETEREVYDSEGNLVEPYEVEEAFESRRGICWHCKGAGWFQDAFVTAGRIKALPCQRCKGSGKIYSGSIHLRVNATFRLEIDSKVRRVERKNGKVEVSELRVIR